MKRSNTRLVTVATSGAHHAFSFIGTDVNKSTFTENNAPFVVTCLDFVIPFNSTIRVIRMSDSSTTTRLEQFKEMWFDFIPGSILIFVRFYERWSTIMSIKLS